MDTVRPRRCTEDLGLATMSAHALDEASPRVRVHSGEYGEVSRETKRAIRVKQRPVHRVHDIGYLSRGVELTESVQQVEYARDHHRPRVRRYYPTMLNVKKVEHAVDR